MKLPLSFLLLLSLSLFQVQPTGRIALNAVKDDPFIKHISTLPSPDSLNPVSFFEKVFRFIVGDEPVKFSNPVNVYSSGIHDTWIVNQGDGNILHHLNGETEKIPAFRKKSSPFPSLVSICPFGQTGFLFTDSRLNKVYILSKDGKMIIPLSESIQLSRPTGIAYSEASKEIWVVETGAHRISVLNKAGERIRTIGERGNAPLQFNFPTYIWIDGSGRIYIVDSMNFRIQILSEDGKYITSFGKQGDVTGTFARPRGVATDSKGNIYVVDALFNTVQIFDTSGRLLYYFGNQGRGKYQFWMPSGIFIDRNDFIYVSDSYNGRVQIFQLIKNN